MQWWVTQINVVIYADGWLVSIWGDGKPYQKDNNNIYCTLISDAMIYNKQIIVTKAPHKGWKNNPEDLNDQDSSSPDPE